MTESSCAPPQPAAAQYVAGDVSDDEPDQAAPQEADARLDADGGVGKISHDHAERWSGASGAGPNTSGRNS